MAGPKSQKTGFGDAEMGHQEHRRRQDVGMKKPAKLKARAPQARRKGRSQHPAVAAGEVADPQALPLFCRQGFGSSRQTARPGPRSSGQERRKTERQPKTDCSQPPTRGRHCRGEGGNIMVMRDIRRWAGGPSKRSRTMARLMTMPAPAVMPCRPRKIQSCSMRVAKAQPAEASRRGQGRRDYPAPPRASEMAPCQRSWQAKGGGRRSGSAAPRGVAWSFPRFRGKTAGRFSMENGPRAERAARSRAMPGVAGRRGQSGQSWARRRYWMASATWGARTSVLAARSAMVRATRAPGARPGRKVEPAHGLLQKGDAGGGPVCSGCRSRPAPAGKRWACPGARPAGPGRFNPLADGGRGFALGFGEERFAGQGRHFDLQVDAVEEGPRNARPVARHPDPGRALATAAGMPLVAAGQGSSPPPAGIRREFRPDGRPGRYGCGLIRAARAGGFQHLAVEFGQFVEEQHALVGQRDLTRARRLPPPPGPPPTPCDGGCGRGGRKSSRAGTGRPGKRRRSPGGGWPELWHEPRQAGGQHGFSGAGRPDHHE